jgi:hypothetical protein
MKSGPFSTTEFAKIRAWQKNGVKKRCSIATLAREMRRKPNSVSSALKRLGAKCRKKAAHHQVRVAVKAGAKASAAWKQCGSKAMSSRTARRTTQVIRAQKARKKKAKKLQNRVPVEEHAVYASQGGTIARRANLNR